MTEPSLDCPGIVPLVGEDIATGVAKHVRVRLQFEAEPFAGRPLDHSGKAGRRERRAALTHEDEDRLGGPPSVSRKERTTVDRDRLAGHVSVAHKHHDHLRDLVTNSSAPNRNAGRDARVDERLAHLRIDQARRDGVDRHALPREPQGVAARQTFEPGLGGTVGDADRAGADASPDRGDIDDSAPAPRPHAPQNVATANSARNSTSPTRTASTGSAISQQRRTLARIRASRSQSASPWSPSQRSAWA